MTSAMPKCKPRRRSAFGPQTPRPNPSIVPSPGPSPLARQRVKFSPRMWSIPWSAKFRRTPSHTGELPMLRPALPGPMSREARAGMAMKLISDSDKDQGSHGEPPGEWESGGDDSSDAVPARKLRPGSELAKAASSMRHELVQPPGHCANCLRLRQIHARPPQLVHRVLAAPGAQQVRGSGPPRPGSAAEDRGQQHRRRSEAGRVLVDVVGRAEEVGNPRPCAAVVLVQRRPRRRGSARGSPGRSRRASRRVRGSSNSTARCAGSSKSANITCV